MELSERDWPDDLPEWEINVCQTCLLPFHGWCLKTKCRICSIPVFPSVRHVNSVAVRFAGKVYSLPAPNRHHNILKIISVEHGKTWPNIQGFLDNSGKFLGRHDALRIALAANQVIDPKSVRSGRLYSEDLW